MKRTPLPRKRREGPSNEREAKPRARGEVARKVWTPRERKCKHCKAKFLPRWMGQTVEDGCQEAFALAFLQKTIAKRVRKATADAKKEVRAFKAKRRAGLEKLKSITELEHDCKDIVQEIARIRDRHDGCISCHMGPNYGGRWHGSHFRQAGNNAAVQFHLWNIHKACAQCNLFRNGNVEGYEPRLIAKIGQDRVDWLKSQTQPVKYTEEYLRRFKAVMGKRLRRMRARARRDA